VKKLWQYMVIASLLASPFFEANAVGSCPSNSDLTGSGWGRRLCVIGREKKEMCFRCSENLSQEQINNLCSETFPQDCSKRCDSDFLEKCKRACKDKETCQKECMGTCKVGYEKACCEKNCKGNCEGTCKEDCEKNAKGYCNETCDGVCTERLTSCEQNCEDSYKKNCVECPVETPSAWHGDC
jgi:hypothetical protein